MLTVSAREKGTGLQKRISIDNALARYEREELDSARERLDELWEPGITDYDALEHDGEPLSAPISSSPELVAGPREGQRETVQAKALLEKAARLLETVQPEDRPEVERLMDKVRTALTDRQWAALATATNGLTDVLFYLEDA
jgi:molecular chaperone DnaK